MGRLWLKAQTQKFCSFQGCGEPPAPPPALLFLSLENHCWGSPEQSSRPLLTLLLLQPPGSQSKADRVQMCPKSPCSPGDHTLLLHLHPPPCLCPVVGLRPGRVRWSWGAPISPGPHFFEMITLRDPSAPHLLSSQHWEERCDQNSPLDGSGKSSGSQRQRGFI